MEKIRWGIIGCGDVTEVKSGPAFQNVENSELVAVMRRTSHLAEDYAKRHGVRKWYDDADDLINDPDVDAVYIATPPSSHREYAIKVAKAGKPIYVEKPMALNFQECNEMISACKEAGVPLYVAYYRRSMPRFIKIKELLDNDAIGDVRFVTTTQYQKASEDLQDAWRVQPEISGGGLFFDMGSHTLDILDYLLGPIVEVEGFTANQAGNYQVEDIVSSAFVFESGIHGTGNWCFSAFDDVDINEIIGSKGKITFSTLGNEPVVLTNLDGTTEFAIEMPKHVHQPLVKTIVGELTGTGETCPSNGTSGARTNMIIDKIFN